MGCVCENVWHLGPCVRTWFGVLRGHLGELKNFVLILYMEVSESVSLDVSPCLVCWLFFSVPVVCIVVSLFCWECSIARRLLGTMFRLNCP